MVESISIGKEYLLDGKTVVKVIKPLNRSNTVFSVEIDGRSVTTVEKDRLHPIPKKLDPDKETIL